MCLLTQSSNPKTASKDIPIFKILAVDKNKLISPWREMKYELNELYINKCEVKPKMVYNWNMIEEGYYHAFVSLKSALSKFDQYPGLKNFYKKGTLKIFKGIIPKGSKCYLGIEGDIAANQIKITEECMS